MTKAVVGICTIQLHLPGVGSLKQKRGILKSMLARLHNTFNVAAAEIDRQDHWQSAVIAVASISNSAAHSRQVLERALDWIEENFPDELVTDHQIEVY